MTGRARPLPALLLVAILLVWEPVTFALTASASLSRLSGYGLPAFLLLGYRALVVGLGIAAGRSLWGADPGGVRLAQWWVPAHMAALVLTFATPYFPSNRLPGTKGPMLFALLTIDAAWWIWLQRWRRIRDGY